MTKHWHVIGASGFVGSYIISHLEQAKVPYSGYDLNPVSIAVKHLDITKQSSIIKALSVAKPNDVIILAAALPNVEWVEAHSLEAAKVNVYGVKKMVDFAKRSKCRLVFYSSDYIFDGLHGPYLENDIPNPINHYGAQKLSAEYYIMSQLANYLIIRTTGVFGFEEARKNFLMSFYDRMLKGGPVVVPQDQIATPIYVKDLAGLTVELARSLEINGVINVVGPELISRVQLAKKIASVFNLDQTNIEAIPTVKMNQAASRPLKSGLKTEKLRHLGLAAKHITDALREIAQEHSRHFKL